MNHTLLTTPQQQAFGAQVKAISGLQKTDNGGGFFMAQVYISELFDQVDESLLPWAHVSMPIGNRINEGEFIPLEVGDWVWVDFPYMTHGKPDTRKPRITGTLPTAPDQVPTIPHDAFGGPEKLEHKRTSAQPEAKVAEENQTRTVTYGGITVETLKSGTYRITHRSTGSAVEFDDAGNIVLHGENKMFISAIAQALLEFSGGLDINVKGGPVNVDSEQEVNVKAPKINLGEPDALEPSVLGDKLAAAFGQLRLELLGHGHYGNLGVMTSPAMAAQDFMFENLLAGGNVYSTKNTNQ